MNLKTDKTFEFTIFISKKKKLNAIRTQLRMNENENKAGMYVFANVTQKVFQQVRPLANHQIVTTLVIPAYKNVLRCIIRSFSFIIRSFLFIFRENVFLFHFHSQQLKRMLELCIRHWN